MPSDSSQPRDAPSISTQPVEGFATHRDQLHGLAYRMTGSVFEADDIVQETYLRWERADTASIRSVKAWLLTVTTRITLDSLKSSRMQRDTYVGSWLPEPLLPKSHGPDEEMEMDESVAIAFLLLLERLTPTERAAYILHDLFRFDFGEVATILNRTNPTVRKLASRARIKISEHQLQPLQGQPAGSKNRHVVLLNAFFDAVKLGELTNLVRLLSEDITMWADGGRKSQCTQETSCWPRSCHPLPAQRRRANDCLQRPRPTD